MLITLFRAQVYDKHSAAKAVHPLVLGGICSICQACSLHTHNDDHTLCRILVITLLVARRYTTSTLGAKAAHPQRLVASLVLS